MSDAVSKTFGRCMSCTDDLHLGRRVSGIEAHKESCYRRLTNKQGSLPRQKDYAWGLNVLEWLNAEMTQTFLASMPGKISGQLMQDERTASVETVPTWNAATSTLELQINVTARNGETFELVMLVSSVGVELL